MAEQSTLNTTRWEQHFPVKFVDQFVPKSTFQAPKTLSVEHHSRRVGSGETCGFVHPGSAQEGHRCDGGECEPGRLGGAADCVTGYGLTMDINGAREEKSVEGPFSAEKTGGGLQGSIQ